MTPKKGYVASMLSTYSGYSKYKYAGKSNYKFRFWRRKWRFQTTSQEPRWWPLAAQHPNYSQVSSVNDFTQIGWIFCALIIKKANNLKIFFQVSSLPNQMSELEQSSDQLYLMSYLLSQCVLYSQKKFFRKVLQDWLKKKLKKTIKKKKKTFVKSWKNIENP